MNDFLSLECNGVQVLYKAQTPQDLVRSCRSLARYCVDDPNAIPVVQLFVAQHHITGREPAIQKIFNHKKLVFLQEKLFSKCPKDTLSTAEQMDLDLQDILNS